MSNIYDTQRVLISGWILIFAVSLLITAFVAEPCVNNNTSNNGKPCRLTASCTYNDLTINGLATFWSAITLIIIYFIIQLIYDRSDD